MLTHSKKLAISPMAIVAAHTTGIREFSRKKTQDILLFALPDVSPDVERLVQLQGFMREYAQTIISPMENCHEECVLDISHGKEHYYSEVHMFLHEFARLAAKHSPISCASHLYWPLPGARSRKFYWFVGRELCESIAAYLLGFVHCEDKKRCWDPFYDRPEIKGLVIDFLEATMVPPVPSRKTRHLETV